MLLTSDQSLCPGSRATDFINDDKSITLQKYEDLKHTLQTKQQRVCVCVHERKSTYRSVVLSILYRCVKQERKAAKIQKKSLSYRRIWWIIIKYLIELMFKGQFYFLFFHLQSWWCLMV